MADDPIARELSQLRADMHDDFADVKAKIAELVRADVYELQRSALDRRITALETQRAEDARQRRSDRRWLIGVVVVPVVVAVVQIVLSLRGPS